jgi:hypothetical protein
MSFLEWTFLFGVVAVAGPVLAHLLAKPRFKRVPFTMLQFLRSSQIESHSRKNVRDLLILLLRCMIIILIALLFAQPILHKNPEPKEAGSIYYLGLDDSISMAYSDGSKNYFEQMKDDAMEHIVSAEADAVFNLCSLVSGIWNYNLSKQQALAEVQALKIKTGRADIGVFLSGVDSSQRKIRPEDKISVTLMSDFTPDIMKQFYDVQEPSIINNLEYKCISSSKPINNASIINARTVELTPEGLLINVTIANYGTNIQRRNLSAKVGAKKSASLEVELFPSQVKVYPIQIEMNSAGNTSSFIPLEISLSSGDNLSEDDTYYLAVRMPQQKNINVLLVETQKDDMFLLDIAMQTLSGRGSNSILKIKRVSVNELSSSSLEWADVMVCSEISDRLNRVMTSFPGFIETGGRAVFFVSDRPTSTIAKNLWNSGIIPALPVKYMQEQVYAEAGPYDKQIMSKDDFAAKALSNYRIDKVLFGGYWQCNQHPDGKCLWRYTNETGFIYFKQSGSGSCILINTSSDDELGTLTKSSVSIALCQYLIGQRNRFQDYSFVCDERITLYTEDTGIDNTGEKEFWIQNCRGNKQQASLTKSFISVTDPGGTGWIKTISEPSIYAGVNLPEGETDMTKPVIEEVANAMNRVFTIGQKRDVLTADSFGSTKESVPVWRYLVWLLIGLILIESTVANRLKR